MKTSTAWDICRGSALSLPPVTIRTMDWTYTPLTLLRGWAIRTQARQTAHRHYAIGGYGNGALQVPGDGEVEALRGQPQHFHDKPTAITAHCLTHDH